MPTRDEATERDVDPMRVVNIDAHWYLEAWCHRAEGVRLFRLDRIEAIEVLDDDGTPPADARPRDLDAGVFTPSPTDLLVRLRLEPAAAWVSDYYPTERVEWLAGGSSLVSLRTADTAWLRRLLLAAGVAGDRPGAGLPRGRGARRRAGGPARLRGPRPDLAARRVGWSACGGGC